MKTLRVPDHPPTCLPGPTYIEQARWLLADVCYTCGQIVELAQDLAKRVEGNKAFALRVALAVGVGETEETQTLDCLTELMRQAEAEGIGTSSPFGSECRAACKWSETGRCTWDGPECVLDADTPTTTHEHAGGV